jgi:hypothetical protein
LQEITEVNSGGDLEAMPFGSNYRVLKPISRIRGFSFGLVKADLDKKENFGVSSSDAYQMNAYANPVVQ